LRTSDGQHCLIPRQEQRVTAPARAELDLRIGLAAVGLEAQRHFAVTPDQPLLASLIRALIRVSPRKESVRASLYTRAQFAQSDEGAMKPGQKVPLLPAVPPRMQDFVERISASRSSLAWLPNSRAAGCCGPAPRPLGGRLGYLRFSPRAPARASSLAASRYRPEETGKRGGRSAHQGHP